MGSHRRPGPPDDGDALEHGLFGHDGPDPGAAGPGMAEHDRERPDLADGLFGDPHERHPPRRRRARRGLVKGLWTIIALAVLAAIVIGLVAGVMWWKQRDQAPTDWAGTGESVAVVRVQSGDTLSDVAATLAQSGIIADAATFVAAAEASGKLSALAPGYYAVHAHSAAAVVVKELADPATRLGHLRIIPGQTLADRTVVATDGSKTTKEGIISAITAACVPTNGDKSCFSTDELWKVAETAGASDLGVVAWAASAMDEAPQAKRRLEGLILPGDYDIAPGSSAEQALKAVVASSAAQWNMTGIVAGAKEHHLSPYQMATIASLVQAEAVGSDMRKVATVIYNRLDDDIKLKFDSTVNYGLDRAQISTTNAERLDPDNPYSTYAHPGLTPTPIGAPGSKAIDAAIDPAIGDWLYFVTVTKDGETCFSVTDTQHEKCVEKARANGVFG